MPSFTEVLKGKVPRVNALNPSCVLLICIISYKKVISLQFSLLFLIFKMQKKFTTNGSDFSRFLTAVSLIDHLERSL